MILVPLIQWHDIKGQSNVVRLMNRLYMGCTVLLFLCIPGQGEWPNRTPGDRSAQIHKYSCTSCMQHSAYPRKSGAVDEHASLNTCYGKGDVHLLTETAGTAAE